MWMWQSYHKKDEVRKIYFSVKMIKLEEPNSNFVWLANAQELIHGIIRKAHTSPLVSDLINILFILMGS